MSRWSPSPASLLDGSSPFCPPIHAPPRRSVRCWTRCRKPPAAREAPTGRSGDRPRLGPAEPNRGPGTLRRCGVDAGCVRRFAGGEPFDDAGLEALVCLDGETHGLYVGEGAAAECSPPSGTVTSSMSSCTAWASHRDASTLSASSNRPLGRSTRSISRSACRRRSGSRRSPFPGRRSRRACPSCGAAALTAPPTVASVPPHSVRHPTVEVGRGAPGRTPPASPWLVNRSRPWPCPSTPSWRPCGPTRPPQRPRRRRPGPRAR